MTGKPEVSVLIPTYKRGRLIKFVLEALTCQTFKDFEVLIVLKPSGDETEATIEQYRKHLNIRLILQKHGSLVNGINLGFRHARGRIIAFVDDDAIPFPDWIEKHMENYQNPEIGGVGGDVISVNLRGEFLKPVEGETSQVLPEPKSFKDGFRFEVWNQPIEGLEDHLVYVSKAGIVNYNAAVSSKAKHQPVKSILGMGANMSILAEAVNDFKFSSYWIRSLGCEQYLGMYLWRQGRKLIFDSAAKVRHIIHGATLSRNITNPRADLLRFTENNLLFYRLYGLEPKLSIMHRIAWLIFETVLNIKKVCVNKDFSHFIRLKSKFHSEYIGIKWLLYRRLGLKYSPLVDLKKLV